MGDRDFNSVIQDHEDGELTASILMASLPAPCADRMQAEILTLSKMIDAEPDGPRHTDLCAAFRALNWARAPDSFAPPSRCVLP